MILPAGAAFKADAVKNRQQPVKEQPDKQVLEGNIRISAPHCFGETILPADRDSYAVHIVS